MGDTTAIAWTDSTWNPVRGCTKVSAGCKNCYAERFAERWRGVPGHPFKQGFDLRLVPEALELPFRWKKPRRVFVNSMSDLFHKDVPDAFIGEVFAVMANAPQHTFQVLTKRAERMRRWCSPINPPLPNLWLGVSVEDQAAADERIPHLLATPAAVRFLSCEPLLGPVTLQPTIDAWAAQVAAATVAGRPIRPLPPRIGWVIVGGESGPGARPCDVAWIRSLLTQCRTAQVPAFCKQLGALPVMGEDAWRAETPTRLISAALDERAPPGTVALALNDRKGGDLAEWPADLQVREMPETTP